MILSLQLVIEMDLEGVCSHIMDAHAYGESINKRRLPATGNERAITLSSPAEQQGSEGFLKLNSLSAQAF